MTDWRWFTDGVSHFNSSPKTVFRVGHRASLGRFKHAGRSSISRCFIRFLAFARSEIDMKAGRDARDVWWSGRVGLG